MAALSPPVLFGREMMAAAEKTGGGYPER